MNLLQKIRAVSLSRWVLVLALGGFCGGCFFEDDDRDHHDFHRHEWHDRGWHHDHEWHDRD